MVETSEEQQDDGNIAKKSVSEPCIPRKCNRKTTLPLTLDKDTGLILTFLDICHITIHSNNQIKSA